jgi:hypothetical protein
VVLAAILLALSPADRLYVPEEVALGRASGDSYFHLAIAQMLAWFGVPSLGADGLVLQHYHFGSHAVAAGLAKAAGTPVPVVYVYWVVACLKIQLLWAMLWSGDRSRDAASPGPPLAFRLTLGVFFLWLGESFLESESFLLGASVFLGAVPLARWLANDPGSGSTPHRVGVGMLLALAFVCATLKVSVGFFCATACAWILLRGMRDRVTAIAGACALAGLAAYVYLLLLIPGEQVLTRAGRA